ncbi:MAG: type II toxin-antitoxin system ParD family antitoxin [Gallionellaceae bacterium]|nr:type II toxin-antitoxin system ParD family antitoxin [Gallionellaceae bacterium]
MPAIEKRTVSLPSDQAAFIDAKVQAGDYASASEVVRAGLRALKERDAVVEQWLRGSVLAAHKALEADPSRALSVEEAFSSVRDIHAERSKTHQ